MYDTYNTVAGTPFTVQFQATGGSGSYTWTLQSGELPAGLSLAPDGEVSGTPTTVDPNDLFTVQVSDSAGDTATSEAAMAVEPPLSIYQTDLPPGDLGVVYNGGIATAGGAGPNTGTLLSGSLPPGLGITTDSDPPPNVTSFNSIEVISGTPTEAGTFTFVLEVTDKYGDTSDASGSITIFGSTPQILTSSLPSTTEGDPYTATLSASGGSGGYTWRYTDPYNGPLPLSSDGVLDGVAVQSDTFGVEVTDSAGATAYQTLSLSVAPLPPISIVPSTLPTALWEEPYQETLTASGGGGPSTYRWSIPDGSSLPSGLTLSPDGVISGVPTAFPGWSTSTFTAYVSDIYGDAGSFATYSIEVLHPTAISSSAGRTIPVGAETTLSTNLDALVFVTPSMALVYSGWLPARPVELQSHQEGTASWTTVNYVTNRAGSVHAVVVKPIHNEVYRWVFSGDSQYAGSLSKTITIDVTPALNIARSASVVGRGRPVTIYGTDSPAATGQTIDLYKLSKNRWVLVGKARLKRERMPNHKVEVGYAIPVRFAKRGTYTLRTFSQATTLNASRWSTAIRVRVN